MSSYNHQYEQDSTTTVFRFNQQQGKVKLPILTKLTPLKLTTTKAYPNGMQFLESKKEWPNHAN